MMEDERDVAALRREYSRRSLNEEEVAEHPTEQFAVWFREALAADLPDANAMTLATASAEGAPSARIVLLKGFDNDGYRFYSNYESRKGRDLEANARAALCFYWPQLERQVRIEGKVEKLSREESEVYFEQRPRLSQIGAWSSSQSVPVDSREELERAFAKMEERFEGEEVPLPDFWGGYLLRPVHIEFWQGRPGRLHDRIVYERPSVDSERWGIRRLSP